MLRANEVIGIDLGTTNSCVAVMEGKVGCGRYTNKYLEPLERLEQVAGGRCQLPSFAWCPCVLAAVFLCTGPLVSAQRMVASRNALANQLPCIPMLTRIAPRMRSCFDDVAMRCVAD